MNLKNILFVSENGSINYTYPGGVQVCTKEIIEYLQEAGFDVDVMPVKTTRRLSDRIKIKLKLDIYNSFDFERLAVEIAKRCDEKSHDTIAINQTGLLPVVELVKRRTNKNLYFFCFSHGNESGDYLHDVAENPNPLKTWKLGKLLLKENHLFKTSCDGLIVISEHEVGLNQWIGADRLMVLPRKLKDESLDWSPDFSVAGYIGTLNHKPNYQALVKMCDALSELHYKGTLKIVGGPASHGENLQHNYSFVKYLGKLDDNTLAKEARTWGLFLNPIFWFSRGSSTKLAQGINWGLPVLTTEAGRRGYILSDNSVVVKGHQPKLFAEAVNEMTGDGDRLRKLRQATKHNINAFESNIMALNLRRFLLNSQCKA